MTDTLVALLESVSALKNLNTEGYNKIVRACNYASLAYNNQKRHDGSSIIDHASSVAGILCDWDAPGEIIAAGVLHAVLNPTYSGNTSKESLRSEFGDDFLNLIIDVSSLEGYVKDFKAPEAYHEPYDDLGPLFERVPWIVLTLRNNPDAVVIRIADRLDMIRNSEVIPLENRRKFASDTLKIYSPLAERLGMWSAKRELEDFSFSVLDPNNFQYWEGYLLSKSSILDEVKKEIAQLAEENHLVCNIYPGRISRYRTYRIGNKGLRKRSSPYHKIPIRVILDTISDCFQMLNLIHERWGHRRDDIKDFINLPKDNGYRSLHTSIVVEHENILNVIIRTTEMEQIAEFGRIAMWKGVDVAQFETQIQSSQLSGNKIIVFTPQLKPIVLPIGATPVDFAYYVHQELGNQCVGANVNGKEVSLSTALSHYDMVQIHTSGIDVGPSPSTIKYAKTPRARRLIRHYLKNQERKSISNLGWEKLEIILSDQGKTLNSEYFALGLQAMSKELRFSSVEELLFDVGAGKLDAEAVILKIQSLQEEAIEKHPTASIKEVEKTYLTTALCKICNPVPPDAIVGYKNSKGNAKIHRKDCKRILKLKPLLDAEWSEYSIPHKADIDLLTLNRIGLIRDIGNIAQSLDIDMPRFYSEKKSDGTARILIGLDDVTEYQLQTIEEQLKSLDVFRKLQIRDYRNALGEDLSDADQMKSSIDNPFTLKPVSGDNFVGRADEIKMLVQNIRDFGKGDAVLLWGARRTGKTSILKQTAETILQPQDYIPVFIDMQKLVGETISVFLHTIAKEIDKKSGNPDIRTPKLHKLSKKPLGHFKSFLENARRFDNRNIVILLDEFQLLSTIVDDHDSLASVAFYFRSQIQHGERISLIFSGGGLKSDLLKSIGDATMLDVTRTQNITRLKNKDAKALIRLRPAHISVSEEVMLDLMRITNNHPYYLQMLCQELVLHVTRQNKQAITYNMIQSKINNWLPDQGEQHFEHFWGAGMGMNQEQQEINKYVLSVIASKSEEDEWVDLKEILMSDIKRHAENNEIFNSLGYLEEIESLKHREKRYKISTPIFKIWIRQKYPVEFLPHSFLKGV